MNRNYLTFILGAVAVAAALMMLWPESPASGNTIAKQKDPALRRVRQPAVEHAESAAPADPSVVRVQLTRRAVAMAELRERLLAESVELVRIEVPTALDEELTVALGPDAADQLVLKKHSVRSKHFRVVTQHPDGTFKELPTGPVRTYIGSLAGEPDALVGATIRPDGLSARIRYAYGPTRAVAPLTPEETALLGGGVAGSGTLHALYRPKALTPQELGCPGGHARDEEFEIAALNADGSMTPAAAQAAADVVEAALGLDVTVKQAEIGFDVAYTFFANRCGSSTATATTTVEDWVNNTLNLVFIRDVLVEHTIGTIVIRTTTATDPYYGNTSGYSTLPLMRDIWNGNHATWPSPSSTHDLAAMACSQAQGVTGLAYVGTIGTGSRYSICTAVSGMGYWTSGARHEVGHNWSLSHGDGAGELTPWEDGFGLMTGGYHDRANSVESEKMIQHRNSRSPGVLDDIGPYTAANIAPYPKQDIALTANVGGPSVTFDVLANDHDANNSSFYIEWITTQKGGTQYMQHPTPTAAATDLGGTLIRSIGTGPNGRDQLVYTPPASGAGGVEDFHIGVRDDTGKGAWGYCKITLGEPPPGPFGEVSETCVLADSFRDWSPDTQPNYGWEFGYYSSGFNFAPDSATNTFYADWIGGDSRLWTRSGSAPEVGQYAQNTHASYPSVRRWTSPYAGRVAIEYDARRLRFEGDGVTVSVVHNSDILMTHTLDYGNNTSVTNADAIVHAGVLYADVAVGDTIDFVLAARSTADFDWTQFHGRILEGGCAREDGGLLMRFPLDTGNEMAKGGSGVYFDARNWGADMSGNNHHLHFSGHDPLFDWKAGVTGNGFDANGSSSYGKTIAQHVGEGATELTLSVWVHPDAKTDNDGIFTCTGADYCGLLVSGYGVGNPGEFRCRNNRVTGPTNSVPIGRWTHIAGVWKSGQYQVLYLDGKEVARDDTPPGGAIADIANWYVGRDREIGGRFIDALIDEATVWDRALSPSEIQALYEETRPAGYYNGAADIYTMENPRVGADFTEITMAAWLRPNTKNIWEGILTTATNAPTESYFGLVLSGYTEGAPVQFRANSNFVDGPPNSAPDGQWLHAVGVWKAGVLQKLYIDGALAGEVPQAQVPSAPANVSAWVVGRDRNSWSNRNFDGDIGEPLIIERALTDAEVLELYQRARTRFNSGQTLLPGTAAVGSTLKPGEIIEASGVYALMASGTGIGGTADSLEFAELNRSAGMADASVKLESLTDVAAGTVAGIMVRESTAADAPFVMLARKADGSLGMLQRSTTGAAVTVPVAWQSVAPGSGLMLRLLRSGDGFAARWSLDGASWTPFGFVTGSLSSNALIGVAASSGFPFKTTTAAISGPAANPLPDDETDIDGDGISDGWEMLHFASLGTSAGGSDDWDGDGVSDLYEFYAGTDPKSVSSFLGFSAVPEVLPNGDIRLVWNAVAGKTYKIVVTADLTSGSWTDVLTGIAGVEPVTSRDVTPPSPAAAQYYKVVVENPSMP